MAAGTVQGGLRVVWSMLILCAMASHEPKKTPLGGHFKKVALSCTAHMSWLKLYTWTLGLGTHSDTHFVVL